VYSNLRNQSPYTVAKINLELEYLFRTLSKQIRQCLLALFAQRKRNDKPRKP